MTQNKSYLLLIILTLMGCKTPSNSSNGDNPVNNVNPGGSSNPVPVLGVKWIKTIGSGVIDGCIGPYTVGLIDSNSNLVSDHNDLTVSLDTPAFDLNFYTDSNCKSSWNQLKFDSGTPTKDFYIKDSKIEPFEISANLADAVIKFNGTISPLSSTGDTLTLLTGATGRVAKCSGPINFGIMNSSGALTKSPANLEINLIASSDSVTIYSDSECLQSTSNITFNSNESSLAIYFKETTLATFNITAESSLGNVTTAIAMGSGEATKLVAAAGEGTQGDCVGVSVGFEDSYSNRTKLNQNVNLTISLNSIYADAYSDSGCNNKIGSLMVPTGSTGATFWVHDSAHENLGISIDSDSLGSTSASAIFHCGFFAGCGF